VPDTRWRVRQSGIDASLRHQARARVEQARAQVAALIRAPVPQMIWTSGATESNNLAILGTARAMLKRGRHVITARTEHKAVLDPCRRLEQEGFQVTFLDTDREGLIAPEQVRAALRNDTVLVSIMHANNEIGVLQDDRGDRRICQSAVRRCTSTPRRVRARLRSMSRALKCDLLSFTAHKLYGPKGVGTLYVSQAARASLQPLIYGGGHERGLRSGTLPVHQIVGFGVACELARLPGRKMRLIASACGHDCGPA
jgi:cysteine desulfurase